ncbi:MAG: hypothetical protein ACI8RD_004078, partial [Bacillariaceae sp.]
CTTEEMSNSTRKMKTNYSSERCWVTTFLLEHIQLSISIVNTYSYFRRLVCLFVCLFVDVLFLSKDKITATS